ncbi:MAG: exodeoxyribonuclease V subunit gamma [Desulfobacterales bacterium]|nr:exodeoxyribonuclease V subunit gamma [Desulfobacterales bacterium]
MTPTRAKAGSCTFDLIAQAPRPGDRSRRNDDKYLFLEALLSARRQALHQLRRSEHPGQQPRAALGRGQRTHRRAADRIRPAAG